MNLHLGFPFGLRRALSSLILMLFSVSMIAQSSFDSPFAQEDMKKDLDLFRDIRLKANSGVLKYRTQHQIDSIYKWANKQIKSSKTIGDFYKVLCQITDFEGSCHNDTSLPKDVRQTIGKSKKGYFPIPIKIIEGRVLINSETADISVGSEIVAINDIPIDKITHSFYKYYTTDGYNTSGKQISINVNFPLYYRFEYGLLSDFKVEYMNPINNQKKSITLNSVSYAAYIKKFRKRYSKPFEKPYGKDESPKYKFEYIDDSIGMLTVNTFSIGGNAKSKEHLDYIRFLDSIQVDLINKGINDLIIDIRNNGGGTDPNDMVTYQVMADRSFSENIGGWVSFNRIPYWKHIRGEVSPFLKPFAKIIYSKMLRKEFPSYKDGKYYQAANNTGRVQRHPGPNVFKGKVYLLISPRVASAGSMFAALAASNKNTTVIGEETLGGYYGHNGNTPIRYTLPKSKIKTKFSIVNLTQDVPQKDNQLKGRGIMPDHPIVQTKNDFFDHVDTQFNYTVELVKRIRLSEGK